MTVFQRHNDRTTRNKKFDLIEFALMKSKKGSNIEDVNGTLFAAAQQGVGAECSELYETCDCDVQRPWRRTAGHSVAYRASIVERFTSASVGDRQLPRWVADLFLLWHPLNASVRLQFSKEEA